MDIFVQPTWELMGQVLTGVDLSNFEINRSNWKAREAFYDEELSNELYPSIVFANFVPQKN